MPWIGVMAAGYAFGRVLEWPIERRNRACLMIGGAAIVAVRRASGHSTSTAIRGRGRASNRSRFSTPTKYPASLLFLLMTLGPLIALMPAFERARGTVANALELFGRVPLFYYVLHIPLIHVAAIIVSLVRTGAITPWLFGIIRWSRPISRPATDGAWRCSTW